MSRCLLHKNKLDDFKLWLDKKRIPHRPGRGEFQVLQVALPDGQWGVVYDRIEAPEHYTVTAPMEYIVRRFLQARREKDRAIERKVRGSEMSEKSEALRLADLLEKMPLGECDHQAAAELRRLSKVEAQRDALLAALRPFAETDLTNPTVRDTFGFDVLFARAVIKSVEEGTEALRRMAVLVIANHPPESWMSFQEGYAAGAAHAREESAQAARIAMLGTEWPLTERVMRAIRARGQR